MTRPEPDALPPRRRGFFVYYKVARMDADRLRASFAQAAAAASPSLPWRAELMRRAEPVPARAVPRSGARDEEPDPQTWMEIYWLDDGCDADDWIDGPLRQQIEALARAAGVHDLVRGQRHYEAFESCV